MSIKKAFIPLVELLEANKGKTVSSIMEKVLELTSAKAGGGGRASNTVHKNDAGDVTHVFCYYHKKWEELAKVEYGKKASSPTGYSNMCKEGTAAWTKQQRDAKKGKDDLLASVAAGETKATDIKARMEEIEKDRGKVVRREDKHGTDSPPGGETKATE